VGFAAVLAFGYYLAKFSNPRIWIIKGLLTGFGALIPISVFFFADQPSRKLANWP
jgi:VIT1/CCC1 family predicted Fe2+/Mn2+ transporter